MGTMEALLPTLRCLRAQVETSNAGSVLSVQLHRPNAYNAVTMEALSELHALLDALQLHPSVFLDPDKAQTIPRVVILHGSGAAFCAGVDIKAAERGVGGRVWGTLKHATHPTPTPHSNGTTQTCGRSSSSHCSSKKCDACHSHSSPAFTASPLVRTPRYRAHTSRTLPPQGPGLR